MTGNNKKPLRENVQDQTIRLNKYISDAGICSRREADRLIEKGKVIVDQKKAVLGMQISPEQVVLVNGRPIKKEEKTVLIALNKPVGIVCTAQKKEKDNIVDFVNYPLRIFPIGRLDKDSQGLLLMTNNGDLANKIMRAGNGHEKEYIVTVNKNITGEFLKKMASGVPILDTVTRKCKIYLLGKNKFKIILTQGLNRQIRRMCEHLGYRVMKLERVRIMNIHLGDLKIGAYREVTAKEQKLLFRQIRESSNETVIEKNTVRK